MKLRQFIPVLIIAAGVWAYHNSFQGPFIFDDLPSIPENPHIRHLWPLREAMSAPYCTVIGRPVVCLSLALNYALGGLNVWGYHAFNLTVHLACALVLFGILRRTFESGKLRDRFGASAVWLAGAIALIWEVHPLQTECVDYIVQRTESLMGLFLLLTLYCTLRGSQSSRPRAWYLAAVVSCVMGMASKEVMVGAPLIVLLYDRVFLASSFREQWRQRWGLYVGLAGAWLILPQLVADTHYRVVGVGRGVSSWQYLETQAAVIPYYLRLCFWPRQLVIDYDDWPIANSLGDVWSDAMAVVALLSGAIWAFRRHPSLGFLGAWFFLILAPTSSFLPIVGEAASERRMYLPLAAVVTMVVVGAFALGKRLFHNRQGVLLGCVAGGFLVVLFSFLTIQRNQDYRSEVTIWQDTVEKRPNNFRAHNGLGLALMQTGKVQEAIGQYQQAVRLKPDYVEAHTNLGNALMGQGKVPEAIEQCEEALRIKPDYAEAHNNLGNALARAGNVPEAISHYEQALRIKPDYAEAHYNLGNALEQTGRVQEAIGHYEQTLRIKPDYAEAHNNLGAALMGQGRLQQAIGQYEQALHLKPDNAEAHYNLGNALLQAGEVPEAIAHYEQALRVKPDYAEAHNNLGAALMGQGRLQEATGHYEQVVRLAPDFAEAHYNLGIALEQLGRVQEAIQHYEQALRIKPNFAQAQNALVRLQAGQ